MSDRLKALLAILLLGALVAGSQAFFRSLTPKREVAVKLPGLDRPATP